MSTARPEHTDEDVTSAMLEYREASRLLWNCFFAQKAERGVDFDLVGAFDAVRRQLLAAFLLPVFQGHRCSYPGEAGTDARIQVVPRFSPARVSIRRPTQQGVYWDDPIEELDARGLLLDFIDFYDFDRFGPMELRFARVRIAACPQHPHLVGRDALIDAKEIAYRLTPG